MGVVIQDEVPEGAEKKPAGKPAPASTQMSAANIRDIYNEFTTACQLGQDAYDYHDEIMSIIRMGSSGITSRFINITELDAIIFSSADKNVSIGLMFAETYESGINEQPAVDAFLEHATKQINDGSKLADCMVVRKEDYPLAKKMATWIENTMKMMTSGLADDITLGSFEGNLFRVNQNPMVGKERIDKMNPQASRPRTDITASLEFSTGELNAHGEKKWDDLLTIGGYTQFIDQGTTQFGIRTPGSKILPIVKITSIVSKIPSDSLVSMALPMAVVAWIIREGYLAPFTRFSKDDVNLGNLIVGEDDKPVFLESAQQLGQFVRDMLAPPALAIDITNGRARIPGLETIYYDQARMHQRIAMFLGLDPDSTAVKNIMAEKYQEYVGVTGDGLDSRCVDYLNLVSQKVEHRKCRDMLFIPSDPKARGAQIAEFAEYQPLFHNICVVLNADYVKQLGSMFNAVAIKWDGPWIDNNGMNLDGINANYAGMPSFGAQQANPWASNSFNPYG